jgi:hypothetical protein
LLRVIGSQSPQLLPRQSGEEGGRVGQTCPELLLMLVAAGGLAEQAVGDLPGLQLTGRLADLLLCLAYPQLPPGCPAVFRQSLEPFAAAPLQLEGSFHSTPLFSPPAQPLASKPVKLIDVSFQHGGEFWVGPGSVDHHLKVSGQTIGPPHEPAPIELVGPRRAVVGRLRRVVLKVWNRGRWVEPAQLAAEPSRLAAKLTLPTYQLHSSALQLPMFAQHLSQLARDA